MSNDFTLGSLIGLVRIVRSLSQRGDNLAKPLSEDHKALLTQAAHAWIDRIINSHLAPDATAPEITLRDLIGIAKACDAMVVRGDGHATPLSAAVVSITYAARQVALARAAQHENGDLLVEHIVQSPMAAEARARAAAARANPETKPAPVVALAPVQSSPVLAPQPRTEPVKLPEAAPTLVLGDSFLFSPTPEAGVRQPPRPPELDPIGPGVPPDPMTPVPAAPPEPGSPQA